QYAAGVVIDRPTAMGGGGGEGVSRRCGIGEQLAAVDDRCTHIENRPPGTGDGVTVEGGVADSHRATRGFVDCSPRTSGIVREGAVRDGHSAAGVVDDRSAKGGRVGGEGAVVDAQPSGVVDRTTLGSAVVQEGA